MKTKAILALLALFIAGGCFQIDQSIELKADLSGTADAHMDIDFGPMVVAVAQLTHEMQGKEGPATADELEKAKTEFRKTMAESTAAETLRAGLEKELPAGVKLLDFGSKPNDLTLESFLKLAFGKIQDLTGVKMPSSDPTQPNVAEAPFRDMEVVEDGETLTLHVKVKNPLNAAKEVAKEKQLPLDADAEKRLRDAFSKMRVTYRITAPFAIVSHNATRKEGNTLVWEYDLARFDAIEKAGGADDADPRVTYKR